MIAIILLVSLLTLFSIGQNKHIVPFSPLCEVENFFGPPYLKRVRGGQEKFLEGEMGKEFFFHYLEEVN